jgi:F-type H+-transporting ATPase subunit delta
VSEESANLKLTGQEDLEEIPVLHGRVSSGMPLSVAARKRITQRFEDMLGCRVLLSCRVDKNLIAGIRMEIDGRLFDGSLFGQLTDVRKMLLRHDEENL